MAGPSSGALHEYNDLESAQYPYSQDQHHRQHQNCEDSSPESEFEIVADYRSSGQAGDSDELRAQDLHREQERHRDWQAHPHREQGYESQLLYRQTSESGSSSGQGHSLLGRQPHPGVYHAAGTESEISLPLYRSRSHSILEASQDLLGNTASTATAVSSRTGGITTTGQLDGSMQENGTLRVRSDGPDNQANVPKIRAFDFHTGERYDSAESGTPAQAQAGGMSGPASSSLSNSAKARHVDFAASVTQALHEVQDKTRDEKVVPPRPGLERMNSDYDMDDDHNTTFDDYDWSDDDELVKQLDERYEKEYKEQQGANAPGSRRRTVIRQFSPVHLAKLLAFTFLGNMIAIILLITPALVVQFLVKRETDDEHTQFVCDNIQAWCYWIAFNLIAKWIIHAAFEIIPRIVVWVIELVWGDSNEKFRGWVELFTASKGYIKPLFFAGFFWGSFAITFNSIFDLRDSSDPRDGSRAPYTYRVYQVVELFFFIALIYSFEKIIIRFISLQFHAVAFSDRIKENGFALATIDKLKDYRPKRKTRTAIPGTPHGHRGASQYFGSLPIPRSGATTPSISFGRHAHTSSAPGTPALPGAPEPAHTSVWSRLPIPGPFKAGHATEAPIALEMTSNLAQRRRQGTQDSAESTNTPATTGSGSGAATPGTPGTPMTPGAIAEQIAHPKHKKRSRLFNKSGVSAQEIARQAMTDPLKTLQNPTLVKNGLGLDFASAGDAKKLARDLFHAFRQDTSRSYLVTSDFYPAFPTQKEAEAAFAVFDKDGNGDISRPEIRHTILAAYKERRFLARSLQDVSEAVSTLDQLFQVAAWIIIALIAFSIFDLNIWSNLTTAYTLVIAISFIFKSAAQNLFDSVIFLFATHPFDTGDRIFLEGDTFVVKQLGLFSTLFTRWDGTETLIANSKLGALTITNLRRSPPQFENATLQVGWDTTLEQLDALESKMNDWLSKDEKRMFAPSTAVVPQSFNYMRWIEITIGMTHRANWQDWGARWDRRTAFHAALVHYTKELRITLVNSAQPIEYWQSDLDNPVLEDDDAADDLDDLRSPLSPAEGTNEIPAPLPPAQPLLGFVPPEGSRMRKRKGHSKKKGMAGSGI